MSKHAEEQKMVDLALDIIARRKKHMHSPVGYRLKFADNLRVCARCGKIRHDHFTSGDHGMYLDTCDSSYSLKADVPEDKLFSEDKSKSTLLLAMIRIME